MLLIRRAEINMAETLSELSLSSKAFWNYSRREMDVFRKELCITADYIRKNRVWLLDSNERVIAYYSLRRQEKDRYYPQLNLQLKKGLWLDHLFVLPLEIGKGYGKMLFNHCEEYLLREKISKIQILADPHSLGFYKRMGCEHLDDYPSSIKDRTTPYLVFRPGN